MFGSTRSSRSALDALHELRGRDRDREGQSRNQLALGCGLHRIAHKLPAWTSAMWSEVNPRSASRVAVSGSSDHAGTAASHASAGCQVGDCRSSKRADHVVPEINSIAVGGSAGTATRYRLKRALPPIAGTASTSIRCNGTAATRSLGTVSAACEARAMPERYSRLWNPGTPIRAYGKRTGS